MNDSLPIVNLSGYRFVVIRQPAVLCDELKASLHALNLKGSIFISPEGINLMVAGNRSVINQFSAILNQFMPLHEFTLNETYSDMSPFGHLVIKEKSEIVPDLHPSVCPAQRSAPYITAPELKTWLDQNKDFTLIDMRNDFEVKLGSFTNAINLGLPKFGALPECVDKLMEIPKHQTIVTFCTGGIRCEKAALYLQRNGFETVYQLHGGILRYLKETDGAHWRGECFVFDERISVDKDLAPTFCKLCLSCQTKFDQTESTLCQRCAMNS